MFFPFTGTELKHYLLLSPELNFLSIVQVKPFMFGLQLKLQPETSLLLGHTIKIFVRRWNQDWDVCHTGVRIKTNIRNSSFLQRKKKYRFEMALRTSHFSQMKDSQWKFHYCIPLWCHSTMAPTLLHQINQLPNKPTQHTFSSQEMAFWSCSHDIPLVLLPWYCNICLTINPYWKRLWLQMMTVSTLNAIILWKVLITANWFLFDRTSTCNTHWYSVLPVVNSSLHC